MNTLNLVRCGCNLNFQTYFLTLQISTAHIWYPIIFRNWQTHCIIYKQIFITISINIKCFNYIDPVTCYTHVYWHSLLFTFHHYLQKLFILIAPLILSKIVSSQCISNTPSWNLHTTKFTIHRSPWFYCCVENIIKYTHGLVVFFSIQLLCWIWGNHLMIL